MYIKNYFINKYINYKINNVSPDLKKIKQIKLGSNLFSNYLNFIKINYYNEEFSKLEKYKNTNKITINSNIAIENLLDLTAILKKYAQKHYIAYGTLLGFYREKNFIKHDVDTDLIIFSFKNFLKILNTDEFKRSKFKLGRVQNGYLSTVFRNGEFIDLYFFEPINFLSEPYFGVNSNQVPESWKKTFKIKSKYLYPSSFISVFGNKFETVNSIENYLQELYGPDWRKPLKENYYNLNY
jgi:hypothetical protein